MCLLQAGDATPAEGGPETQDEHHPKPMSWNKEA